MIQQSQRQAIPTDNDYRQIRDNIRAYTDDTRAYTDDTRLVGKAFTAHRVYMGVHDQFLNRMGRAASFMRRAHGWHITAIDNNLPTAVLAGASIANDIRAEGRHINEINALLDSTSTAEILTFLGANAVVISDGSGQQTIPFYNIDVPHNFNGMPFNSISEALNDLHGSVNAIDIARREGAN